MLKVMFQGRWFDKDDPNQLAELERREALTRASRAEHEAKRQRKRIERQERQRSLASALSGSIDPEFDAWFAEHQKMIREEAELIDPGAPGTRLEQMADLMDDEERNEWIEAGMLEDWALLKEEEFAQGLRKKE